MSYLWHPGCAWEHDYSFGTVSCWRIDAVLIGKDVKWHGEFSGGPCIMTFRLLYLKASNIGTFKHLYVYKAWFVEPTITQSSGERA